MSKVAYPASVPAFFFSKYSRYNAKPQMIKVIKISQSKGYWNIHYIEEDDFGSPVPDIQKFSGNDDLSDTWSDFVADNGLVGDSDV